MRNLYLSLSLLLLSASLATQVGATPPHYIDVREVLVGANDSLFAVHEYVYDNLGSHFNHTEVLSICIYRTSDREPIERHLLQKFEFSLDPNGVETVQRVSNHEEGSTNSSTILRKYGMALAFESHWTSIFVGEEKGVLVDEGSVAEVITRSDLFSIFQRADKENEPPEGALFTYENSQVDFGLINTYFVDGADCYFLAIRRELSGEPESSLRIIPLSRKRVKEVILQMLHEEGCGH